MAVKIQLNNYEFVLWGEELLTKHNWPVGALACKLTEINEHQLRDTLDNLNYYTRQRTTKATLTEQLKAWNEAVVQIPETVRTWLNKKDPHYRQTNLVDVQFAWQCHSRNIELPENIIYSYSLAIFEAAETHKCKLEDLIINYDPGHTKRWLKLRQHWPNYDRRYICQTMPVEKLTMLEKFTTHPDFKKLTTHWNFGHLPTADKAECEWYLTKPDTETQHYRDIIVSIKDLIRNTKNNSKATAEHKKYATQTEHELGSLRGYDRVAKALEKLKEIDSELFMLQDPGKPFPDWGMEPVYKQGSVTLKRLTNKLLLTLEGKLMHHCTGGYEHRCRENFATFSVLENDKHVGTAGIIKDNYGKEARLWRIEQVRGVCNKELDANINSSVKGIVKLINEATNKEYEAAKLEKKEKQREEKNRKAREKRALEKAARLNPPPVIPVVEVAIVEALNNQIQVDLDRAMLEEMVHIPAAYRPTNNTRVVRAIV